MKDEELDGVEEYAFLDNDVLHEYSPAAYHPTVKDLLYGPEESLGQDWEKYYIEDDEVNVL